MLPPLVPCLSGLCLAVQAHSEQDAPLEPRLPAPQALPPFPHAGFEPSQLFVGLVEDVKVSGAPAPPDSQAPRRGFVLEAAHDCVLCYESSIHQRPAKGRTERRRASELC